MVFKPIKPSLGLAVSLLLLISLLMMPFWLILTEPYVIKPSPLNLYEIINPTYYIGLSGIILSLIILFIKTEDSQRRMLNLYLLTSILTTLYIQLPPLSLLDPIITNHTIHQVPIFYIIRNGDINIPNYPFPETVSPQLFASTFVIVTSLPNPLENLNRISLFLLPLLTTLYIYIFMTRLSNDEKFSMIAAVLNIGLTLNVQFMFIRQTYSIPLYIMLALLVFLACKEKDPRFSILSILILGAITISDPAFVILTVIPLALFSITWSLVDLMPAKDSKKSERNFKSPAILTIILTIAFILWIISRSPKMPLSLWNIVQHMWATFINSISEFSPPIYESQIFYGKPSALTFNYYYALIYRISVSLRAISIVLPVLILIFMLLSKKARSVFFRAETLFLISYFLITGTVIITRGYGVTYTPWAVLIIFDLLFVIKKIRGTHKLLSCFLFISLMLTVTSVVIAPLSLNTSGSFTTADIQLSSWLGEHASQNFHVMIPFEFYDWWQDVSYVKQGNYTFTVSWLIPYEGLTSNFTNELIKYNSVLLADTSIVNYQRTEIVTTIMQYSMVMANRLSENYNLVYTSGYPFNTVWLR